MKKFYSIAILACMTAMASYAEPAAPASLPDGVETEQWILTYDYEARFVDVAIQGDKFYLGNLTDEFADVFVVGKIADDIITFPLTRMGYSEEWEEDMYFVPATFDTRYVEDFEEEVEDYFITDTFAFAYDAEGKRMESVEEYSAIFIGDSCEIGALAPAYMEYFFEPSIHWGNPENANDPIDNPEFIYAYHDWWYDCDFVEFYLPSINSSGYPMNPDNMYYVFYVDGKPFTFTTEKYIGLDEDMTEVPYNFEDEVNFDFVNYGDARQLCLYAENYSTVGLKLYYRAPNGTLLESEYVEANIYELSDGEIGSVAVVTNDSPVVDTVLYDLTGHRTDASATGFMIKVETRADGTRTATRVLRQR